MNRTLGITLAVALGLFVGCDGANDRGTAPSGGVRTDVDRPNGGAVGVDVDNTNGVNVDVAGPKRKVVDVDVAPGGGVNVDIDRDAIRERREERRGAD